MLCWWIEVESVFKEDLNFDSLERHLGVLVDVIHLALPLVKKVTSIQTICDAMKCDPYRRVLSDVHKLIWLHSTVPITYLFYIRKSIFNFKASTMTEQRLNNCMLHIHKDLKGHLDLHVWEITKGFTFFLSILACIHKCIHVPTISKLVGVCLTDLAPQTELLWAAPGSHLLLVMCTFHASTSDYSWWPITYHLLYELFDDALVDLETFKSLLSLKHIKHHLRSFKESTMHACLALRHKCATMKEVFISLVPRPSFRKGGYNHWTGLLHGLDYWTTGLTQTAKYMSFSAE